MKVPMGPPPPKNPNPNPNFDPNPNPNPNPNPEPEPPSADQSVSEAVQIVAPDTASATPAPEPDNEAPQEHDPAPRPTPSAPATAGTTVPYTIPPWSESSGYPFSLEVLKDGAIIEQFDVSEKGAYMFGRVELCDFMLEHPTISRFHAVLQFRKDGKAFIYDLGSTHGTTINKKQVKKKVYVELHVGDVIRFGHSSRLYIFQGPSELMPPEGDLNKIRSARIYEEIHDREASLLRARVEASAADGISWGMDEDAPEEAAEYDEDEITWQTYKGQLTERQEKTRGKVIKRMEKVANMKKEIDAIRVKDIAQGGLTQGQQTQIARNEQRISQIMEELDSLEETLNDSIRESLGARVRKVVRGRTKGNVEDEDEILSDDDEFYDRTQKKRSTKKSTEQQSIETADTLLDKREAIINEMEEMKALLMKEREKLVPSNDSGTQGADDLDAYMKGLSSQLVLDKTIQIEKDMGDLQTELDKVMYLLKIADPMGEAAQKRNLQGPTSKANAPVSNITKTPQTKQNSVSRPERPVLSSATEVASNSTKAENSSEEGKDTQENKKKEVQDIQVNKKKTSAYTATKPQWLGYRDDTKPEENHIQEAHSDEEESGGFVDYKDRKKALISVAQEEKIELAAPGLIIRKRKPVEKPGVTVDKAPKVETSSSADGEATAADAVALLLKHDRGYYALEEERKENLLSPSPDQPEKVKPHSKLGKDRPNSKRVLGPLRPDFLDKTPDCETWAPPEGQTGDGRTSLNDRLGY